MGLISANRHLYCITTAVLLSTTLIFGGCATSGIPNESGSFPVIVDHTQRGPVSGVGIEAQDIVTMTDQMIRDMLSNPKLSAAAKAPRVIVDAEFFSNESTLPISLNRASNGRIQFVAQARELKRAGVTDIGTTGLIKAQLGADYRLGGTIASQDSSSRKTGMNQRYYQINFEMFDLKTNEIIWSGMYEFSRVAADDVIYR